MTTATTAARPHPWRRRPDLPAYSVADAARLTGLAPQTVSVWRSGFWKREGSPSRVRAAPVFYLQLVELAFVATLQRLGLSLQRIEAAHAYLTQLFRNAYPSAQHRLLTEGTHVLLDLRQLEPEADLDRLIVAAGGGQLAWRELVGHRFAEFDYEQGLALRWHAAGRQSPVLIVPRRSFGVSSVAGIPTWAIGGRWLAGETVEENCEDFELTRAEVEVALRFERPEPTAAGDPVLLMRAPESRGGAGGRGQTAADKKPPSPRPGGGVIATWRALRAGQAREGTRRAGQLGLPASAPRRRPAPGNGERSRFGLHGQRLIERRSRGARGRVRQDRRAAV